MYFYMISAFQLLDLILDCDLLSFLCDNSSKVIPRASYCNGKVDCLDASDEPVECGK